MCGLIIQFNKSKTGSVGGRGAPELEKCENAAVLSIRVAS